MAGATRAVARRFNLPRRRGLVRGAIALGFIFVADGNCGAAVALVPHLVSRSAETCVYEVIRKRNPPRVVLAHDARLSSWALIGGANRAIAQIGRIIAEARNPSPRPLHYAQRLPIESFGDLESARFGPVLQAWHDRNGRWEPDFYGRLLEWRLLDSSTIAEKPAGSERVLVRHWGADVRTYGKEWVRIAPGRDVEDQPNAELGLWRAALLRESIREGVPEFRKIDFVFRRIGGDLARLQFRRVNLPWRTSAGAALVTSIQVARRTFIIERPDRA